MPKPKGSRKTGGRQPGTPNKATAEFKTFFDEQEFSCPQEWFNIYEALRNAPEQLLYMDIRIKVLERITERLHGKVKEGDNHPLFHAIPIEVKDATTEALLQIAHARRD